MKDLSFKLDGAGTRPNKRHTSNGLCTNVNRPMLLHAVVDTVQGCCGAPGDEVNRHKHLSRAETRSKQDKNLYEPTPCSNSSANLHTRINI